MTNLSIARNFAISKSKGKFISFLDVDDYWNENKLYKQILFLKPIKKWLYYFQIFFSKI